MPPVAVVTDTCHYLPADLVAAHGIHLVSLYVHAEGEARREADITDLDGYYDRLRDIADLPTTSQPSIGEFLAAYEPLLADGGEVVSVHLAGGMSGTCEVGRGRPASSSATLRAGSTSSTRRPPAAARGSSSSPPARRREAGRSAGRRPQRARAARAHDASSGSPSTRSSTSAAAAASAARRRGSARR